MTIGAAREGLPSVTLRVGNHVSL